MQHNAHTNAILASRFGHDSLIALATTDGCMPCVRTVNAVYEDGAFLVITHAASGKMQQIAANPCVALCGDWFTGHGIAQDLGHVLLPSNAARMARLREAFASWYRGGHVDKSDPGAILLRIRLTDGVLFADGVRYQITFP